MNRFKETGSIDDRPRNSIIVQSLNGEDSAKSSVVTKNESNRTNHATGN